MGCQTWLCATGLAAGWKSNNPAAVFPGEEETIGWVQSDPPESLQQLFGQRQEAQPLSLGCEHRESEELSGVYPSLLPALFFSVSRDTKGE